MQRCILAFASIAVASVLFAATDAMAASQHTFVASYGNDASPCSLTLPCRGFAAAVAATISGGEVIVLDSGGYGQVTITQSVSIIAPPGVYAGISVPPGNRGVNIDAPGASVTLRGLTIVGMNGGDSGIYAISAAGGATLVGVLRIERCIVRGMTGIGLAANPMSLVILDSTFEENGLDGIQGSGASDMLVERSRSLKNGGAGIWLNSPAAVIRDSIVASNILDGIFAPNSNLSIEGSEITHNFRGVTAVNSLGVAVFLSISRSNISYNATDGVVMSNTIATPLPLPHGSISDTVVHKNVGYGIYAPPGQMVVSNVTVTSNGNYGICGANTYTRTNNTVFDKHGGGAQTCGLIPLAPV